MRLAWITRDIGLKVFSFLLAGLLFVFVSVESSTPVDVDFRIEYHTDDDILVVGDAPQVVHATLKGPWASLWTFNINTLDPVVIDLTGTGPGTVRRGIDVSEVHAPAGMKVVSVRPAEVEVVLDRRIERMVTVNPDLVGKPAPGFETVSVRVEPPRVRVVGPQNPTQGLEFVYTRPIDISEHADAVEVDSPLRPPPSPLRLFDSTVHVTIDIEEEVIERHFDKVPVALRNAPAGSQLSPKTVTMSVRGPRRAVESMDDKKLAAVIDVAAEAQSGDSRFERTVDLPHLPERVVELVPKPKVVVDLKLPKKKRR
jgi:YbbR domain-containing protein